MADIAEESSVQNIFAQYDRIDHLFMTTGRYVGKNIMDTHPDEFRPLLEERIFGIAK